MFIRHRFRVAACLLACATGSGLMASAPSWAARPEISERKTLVAWVSPADLERGGGSVLTIDDQQGHFDGIVFGEISPQKWMAGSELFHRTIKDQAASPRETADARTVVQIAIVHDGKQITVYREGKEYARHEIAEPQAFGAQAAVLIGKRHILAGNMPYFVGSIDDARIYDVALSVEQIAGLKPNEPSDPKPIAWWNFQDGKPDDVMGAFPPGKLFGKAKIEDGKLMLDGNASFMATPPAAVAERPSEPPPIYHFTSPDGSDCMPFDPNGAIYWKGRYHLGYIYQDHGKHYWGHASSTDLLHWKLHPPMLGISPGDPEKGIFSGNAFIDKRGRVALTYHGVDSGNCIAINADDELNVFKKLAANPLMSNPGWDPHGWLDGDTYYCISGGNPPQLYESKDDELAKWKLLGSLTSKDMPDVAADEDISCPDLFKLGGKDILLCISHKCGARYYIGKFENKQFHPEQHFRMNWGGGACFAPETLIDAKGRRIMWAWAIGYPSTMTLPRVLSLDADGVMKIEPAEEIDSLRTRHRKQESIALKPGADVIVEGMDGECEELQVTIDPLTATQCGVKVRCSPDAVEQTVIVYDAVKKVLRIDLAKSTLDAQVKYKQFVMPSVPNPDVTFQEAPFELKPGETLNLRIYLDKSILEVFANGRQCLTQRIWPSRKDSLGVRLFAEGGPSTGKSIEAWDMTATGVAK